MKFLLSVLLMLGSSTLFASNEPTSKTPKTIVTGADQTDQYFEYLKGKRIGILANPTTIIGKKHLVDSLLSRGINIVKVFYPNMVLEEMPVMVQRFRMKKTLPLGFKLSLCTVKNVSLLKKI
jgi:hypothetical protein